jgi:iron complex outermembrane receptor protein
VQAYVDRTERTVRPTFTETLDIFDVKFQHTLAAAGRHEWAWGAQYRYARDRVENSTIVAFLPAHVNQSWTSLFAQDVIALADMLRLTLGARVERNDYTGWKFLPNARLAWNLSEQDLLWTALARAVRSPSRLDRDTFVPGQPRFILTGGPDVRSETADVVELGYRSQLSRASSYSATLFYADYDHMRSQELGPGGTSVFYANEMEGSVHGLEFWGTAQDTMFAGVGAVETRSERERGVYFKLLWQL